MDKQRVIVSLSGIVPRLSELRFDSPVNWEICFGQQWVVIGPNGAGKTLIADFLQGRHAHREGRLFRAEKANGPVEVKSIAFKDIYSLTDCRNSYYQQRWNSTDVDESILVGDLFSDVSELEDQQRMVEAFHLEEQVKKRLIYLSSGELRKLLIVRTLILSPDVLILDNPFIGLDAGSRDVLLDLLRNIKEFGHTQIVLLLSNPADIPEFITDVLPVKKQHCYEAKSREEFLSDETLLEDLFPRYREPVTLPAEDREAAMHVVTFHMENISVRYGRQTILSGLNWEVKNGEKWSLTGVNGAGKSTLLSLVYADNPQSYANTLYLFDRKRGTGESIWDIKKRIGYVSPEIHLYYNENVPAEEIVASGFFDTIGLHRKCTKEQLSGAYDWMYLFDAGHLRNRLFLTLSSGEQRLILLARAFVKKPDLLVLDEPLHGLDVRNKERVARIIEAYCALPGKTLIYVTHYPKELPACVDKHFVLEKK